MYKNGDCISHGKYCFETSELYRKAVEDDKNNENHTYGGQGMSDQAIAEQCMFQALKGEKSHWFRFMDTLINGCIKDKKEGSVKMARLVTEECFDKAVKISQVYSQYDMATFKMCVKGQLMAIEALKDENYDNPKSKIFFDRDYVQRKNFGVILHPSITVNGDKFEGNYQDTNELFKMICSKLEKRPEMCKHLGLANKKEKMQTAYNNEFGESGTMERAVITFDRIKDR